jgi:hypothetical protein
MHIFNKNNLIVKIKTNKLNMQTLKLLSTKNKSSPLIQFLIMHCNGPHFDVVVEWEYLLFI